MQGGKALVVTSLLPRHRDTQPLHYCSRLLVVLSTIAMSTLSPPVFTSPQHTPFTIATSVDVPTSLQSMEVGEEMESLESVMDTATGEPCVEMDSLSTQLRGSHLEYVTHGNQAPPIHTHLTLAPPQIAGGSHRSHSSGDTYDFGLNPQLAQGGDFYFSYHESGQNTALNDAACSAESRFLLSKSL